jgi:dihydroneopterin aldolase
MMEAPHLAREGQRHVFVRDMVLPASIGVYPHEHQAPQRIRVNLDLAVAEGGVVEGAAGSAGAGLSRAGVGRDDLRRVVNYETIVAAVRTIVAAGHVMLVETLAERIAETCLADARVLLARVRIEKLDVFDDLTSVGVEIERRRLTCPRGGVDSQ